MAKMIEHGADGYFIKESPEIKVDDVTSKANYDNLLISIDKCLKRKSLKEIYSTWDIAYKSKNQYINNFILESNSMLNIAWNLIQQEQLDFGYLTLFQIIELYVSQKYDYRDNSIEIDGVKSYMVENDGDKEVWKLTFKDNNPFKYFFIGEETKEKGKKVENLFKASCVFAFMFKKENHFLEHFGSLNKLRHKIAHEGAKGQANDESIKKVLEIIKMIRL